MADLGDTSMAHTAHKHKMTSWLTVAIIIVASVVLGFAFVLKSIMLTVVGGVLLLVGVVLGAVTGIMDDAE
jgi:uncharacterized membrane protein YoaK (UPF0700 family)